MTNAPVLILGIGNILLRDEGIGVHVVNELLAMDIPEGIEVIDGGTSGADLVDVIANRRKVIVIDAMKADEKPGTVFRMTGDELAEQSDRSISIHEFGMVETLMMARQLHCEPKEVVIYGVQPAQLRPPAVEMSPVIAELVPKLARKVLEEAVQTLAT